MTATPIPRTLAQSVFGDLDVTEIARPPANRKPVITSWVRPRAEQHRLHAPPQAPRGRAARPTSSARSSPSPRRSRRGRPSRRPSGCARPSSRGFRVGCLHGKLKTAGAARGHGRLQARRARRARGDDRDRGRRRRPERDDHDRAGGRPLRARAAPPAARAASAAAAEQSYCLLVSRPKEELTEDAARRLEALVETSRRLRARRGRPRASRRGPAARRAPVGLSDLKFARLARDRELIAQARTWAEQLVDEDPAILEPLGRDGSPPMRIIAGSRKGARIFAPKGLDTRPTGDRVREAVFNLVGPVDGAEVLDLYAGSGAMGLEALSRGARARHLRRVRPRGGRDDPQEPRQARARGRRRPARGRGPQARGRRGGRQALRSRADRPALQHARTHPAHPRRLPARGRRRERASPSSSRTPARSPTCRSRSGRAAATARRG